MTRDEFRDISPKVLEALGDSPRKPSELIDVLTREGLEDTQIRGAVWWMIDEGMVRFRRLKLEAVRHDMDDVLATS